MANLKITLSTEWRQTDAILGTCRACDETIYSRTYELCLTARDEFGEVQEPRWLGVVVCGSCRELIKSIEG